MKRTLLKFICATAACIGAFDIVQPARAGETEAFNCQQLEDKDLDDASSLQLVTEYLEKSGDSASFDNE